MLEKVRQLCCSGTNETTVWYCDGHACSGQFYWQAGSPFLKLTFPLQLSDRGNASGFNHPLLDITRPPRQPTFQAPSSSFGHLTLEKCAQLDFKSSSQYGDETAQGSITLRPSSIWLGDPGEENHRNVQEIELMDTRLGGFFRVPGFESYIVSPEAHPQLFNQLGDPREVWAFRDESDGAIQLGTSGFQLRLSSQVSGGMSHTRGYSQTTMVILSLQPETGVATSQAADDVIYRLENLLSTLGMGDFGFEVRSYLTDKSGRATRAWQLGNRGSDLDPPMSHEILADLSDPKILKRACDGWFDDTDVVRLSRWLDCKALRETESWIARFISVAQAFEVLAREMSPTAKLVTKQARRNAESAVEAALEEAEIDKVFAERILQGLRSSNVRSFPDALNDILKTVENVILPVAKVSYPADVTSMEDFARLVAQTRNDLVHMNDNRDRLDGAFARANKLSLLLCFSFSVVQANMIGLSLDHAHSVLVNNKNVRHGLPNHFLERI